MKKQSKYTLGKRHEQRRPILMLPYMDQVLRAFYQSTHWSTQNSYEDITATSRTLLDFRIPSAIHLQISNKSTPNTFNSLDFSTRSRINGSLSYLYSDAQQLENFMRTLLISHYKMPPKHTDNCNQTSISVLVVGIR